MSWFVSKSELVRTGLWGITPEKPASVYECVRSCRYGVSRNVT